MHHRFRFFSLAGALALVSGFLLTGAGASTVVTSATIHIEPGVTSHLASTTQPFTEAECIA